MTDPLKFNLGLKVWLRMSSRIFAGFILVTMTVNAFWAAWDTSSLQAFLFAPTYGPLFPGVHALSVISVVAATYYLMWVTKSLPMGVLLGMTTVAVHELVWAVGQPLISNQSPFVVAGPWYIVIYVGALALAAAIGTWKQRESLFWVSVIAVAFYWLAFMSGVVSDIAYSSIASPFSIVGWMAVSSGWATLR